MKTCRCRLCDRELLWDGDESYVRRRIAHDDQHDANGNVVCGGCADKLAPEWVWFPPLDVLDLQIIRGAVVKQYPMKPEAWKRALDAVVATMTMADPRAPEGEPPSQNFRLRQKYCARLLMIVEGVNAGQVSARKGSSLVSCRSPRRFSSRSGRQKVAPDRREDHRGHSGPQPQGG